MADITDILQSLTQNISGLEGMTRALQDFDKAKEAALSRGDAKAVLQIENLIKTLKELGEARKEQKKLEEEFIKVQRKGGKVTDDLRKKLDKNAKQVAKSERILTNAINESTEAQKKQTASMIANNEAMMDAWKSSTLLGKTYAGLTSGIAKVAGGLTAGSMALRAWQTHVEGVELQQNILIRQFRGFKEGVDETSDGLLNQAKSLFDSSQASATFSDALRKAQADAIRMGVDAEQVNGVMLDFARIAGTKNPEELQKLTSAVVSVARTMDMDLGSAVDFVRVRMDKFGGTGASAIVAMQNIREETEQVNDIFGRTVVRADDVARTLLDISRSTNVYAIDQRFVSGILRENIARLQSTGDSYELARRKAEAFTKGVTGSAPDWMQVLAGQDLVSQMEQALKKGSKAFESEFGDALDAAAPGLSEKVQDIIGDKSLQNYEKMRLIQELTAGSEVGIAAMNKQILKLAKSSQGIEILAEQFGVTRAEAHGMVQQAKDFEARQQEIAKLIKDPGKLQTLIKEQKVGEKTAKLLQSNNMKEQDKKKALHEILSIRDQEIAAQKEAERIFDQREKKAEIVSKAEFALEGYQQDLKSIEEAVKKGQDEVKTAQANLQAATVSGNEEAKAQAKEELKIAEQNLRKQEIAAHAQNSLINSQEETISQNSSKAAGDEKAQKTMEEMTADNLLAFDKYAKKTGRSFKAMIKELSTIEGLLWAAVGLLGGGMLFKGLAGHLARRSSMKGLGKEVTKGMKGFFGKGSKGGGGGGGGGAAAAMSGDMQKKFAKMQDQAEKIKQRSAKSSFRAQEARAAGDLKKAKILEEQASNLKSEAKDMMKKAKKIAPPKSNIVSKGVNLFKDKMSDIGQKFGLPGSGEVAEGAPKAAAKVADALPEKKSYFGRFMDKAKSGIESVKSTFSDGLLGKVGKMFGPFLKFLSKFTGFASGFITAAMELPSIISDVLEGNWSDALARMIPALTGTIGAALGTVLGGPIGTAIGGAGGSIAGEYLKDYILERDSKVTSEAEKVTKEKPKPQAPKAGNVNITKGMDLSALPQTNTMPAGAEQTQRTPARASDVATATAAMAGSQQQAPSDLVANVSPVNGDGSVTLTIPNFRDAVVGASNLGRGNRIRTSGMS